MCPSQTKEKKKENNEINFPTDLSDLFQGFYTVFSLSLSSAGKEQFWRVFFKTTYIVLVNRQEVAGGKNYCLLLLEAVNFTGYRLIRRTLLHVKCG